MLFEETADDGLIQRFQLAIWPDDVGSWEWIDRESCGQKDNKNALKNGCSTTARDISETLRAAKI